MNRSSVQAPAIRAGFAFLLSLFAAPSLAASLPIGVSYGTVAICIIDSITDSPMPVVEFNVAGAPVARLTPDSFETVADSCSFVRILRHSGTTPPRSWSVEAHCAGPKRTADQTLMIEEDTDHEMTVKNQDGSIDSTVGLCIQPYIGRARRELSELLKNPTPATDPQKN